MINCKICNGKTRNFFSPQQISSYVYCLECDYISKDEGNVVSMEVEKREYDLHQNRYEDKPYVDRFRDMLDKGVIPYTCESGNDTCEKTALDFGSGPEPVLAKLLTREYGHRTDCYDVYYSPERIYEGKTYDLVTCTEVLEHLKNPMEVLKTLKQCLNEQGILAVMTQFHPCDDESFINWRYHRDITHIGFFTPKTMHQIAEMLDLEVVHLDERKGCSFRHKAIAG